MAEEQKAALRQLIANGLGFGEVVQVFAEPNTEDQKRLIELAREKFVREGELEIDDATLTSGSDDHGDYVLAWAWIDDPVEDDPSEINLLPAPPEA